MSGKENRTHDIYRKIRQIGQGHFGCAILVQSEINKQLYVIKKIEYRNREQEERIFNEVKAMKKIRHPYVISYKESFQESKNICIVMEYARGGTLTKRIKSQKDLGFLFEEEQILEWFIQLCLGLKYIHEQKIVHRDLKPDNIFLTDKGLCKIGDFGICKEMKQTCDLAKTKIGTPLYMAPEVWDGKLYNQKSDMWNLGCVLYQLCTLKHAFDAQYQLPLYEKIRTGRYDPIPPKYSEDLNILIAELLNVEPHKRPSTGTILEKDFIKKRKKNIFSKSMNISYQESLELSQRLNKNKASQQTPSFRPRSLSLPSLQKSTQKKEMPKPPRLKLTQYQQCYPIIQQQNKSLKLELKQLQKQKESCENKLESIISGINSLLEDEFTSVQELKEVIKEKLCSFN